MRRFDQGVKNAEIAKLAVARPVSWNFDGIAARRSPWPHPLAASPHRCNVVVWTKSWRVRPKSLRTGTLPKASGPIQEQASANAMRLLLGRPFPSNPWSRSGKKTRPPASIEKVLWVQRLATRRPGRRARLPAPLVPPLFFFKSGSRSTKVNPRTTGRIQDCAHAFRAERHSWFLAQPPMAASSAGNHTMRVANAPSFSRGGPASEMRWAGDREEGPSVRNRTLLNPGKFEIFVAADPIWPRQPGIRRTPYERAKSWTDKKQFTDCFFLERAVNKKQTVVSWGPRVLLRCPRTLT